MPGAHRNVACIMASRCARQAFNAYNRIHHRDRRPLYFHRRQHPHCRAIKSTMPNRKICIGASPNWPCNGAVYAYRASCKRAHSVASIAAHTTIAKRFWSKRWPNMPAKCKCRYCCKKAWAYTMQRIQIFCRCWAYRLRIIPHHFCYIRHRRACEIWNCFYKNRSHVHWPPFKLSWCRHNWHRLWDICTVTELFIGTLQHVIVCKYFAQPKPNPNFERCLFGRPTISVNLFAFLYWRNSNFFFIPIPVLMISFAWNWLTALWLEIFSQVITAAWATVRTAQSNGCHWNACNGKCSPKHRTHGLLAFWCGNCAHWPGNHIKRWSTMKWNNSYVTVID